MYNIVNIVLFCVARVSHQCLLVLLHVFLLSRKNRQPKGQKGSTSFKAKTGDRIGVGCASREHHRLSRERSHGIKPSHHKTGLL